MGDLTWGLCIATKDRLEVLKRCVECAVTQDLPPVEVVVADSSANWDHCAEEIKKVVESHLPGLPVRYAKGEAPSLTVQRNQAVRMATADIVFMIDDDSFMHPGCARTIMEVYEADTDCLISGVQAAASYKVPGQTLEAEQKSNVDVRKIRKTSSLMEWFLAKLLLMSKTAVFLPYDKVFHQKALPQSVAHLPITPVSLFGGFRMTFRRKAVLETPFDPTLRYYCPGEDLDGSYRISRHGMLVSSQSARLHHFVSAAGRLDRTQVAHLWSLNQAVLLRRHAADQTWARRSFKRLMMHRIVTDFLKDALSRRFGFPQMRGSLAALRDSTEAFSKSPEALETWYPDKQERIVKG